MRPIPPPTIHPPLFASSTLHQAARLPHPPQTPRLDHPPPPFLSPSTPHPTGSRATSDALPSRRTGELGLHRPREPQDSTARPRVPCPARLRTTIRITDTRTTRDNPCPCSTTLTPPSRRSPPITPGNTSTAPLRHASHLPRLAAPRTTSPDTLSPVPFPRPFSTRRRPPYRRRAIGISAREACPRPCLIPPTPAHTSPIPRITSR
jgi:hypothetical protein